MIKKFFFALFCFFALTCEVRAQSNPTLTVKDPNGLTASATLVNGEGTARFSDGGYMIFALNDKDAPIIYVDPNGIESASTPKGENSKLGLGVFSIPFLGFIMVNGFQPEMIAHFVVIGAGGGLLVGAIAAGEDMYMYTNSRGERVRFPAH